jgi:hypothetical protein
VLLTENTEKASMVMQEKHKQSPTSQAASSTNPFLSSPTNSGGGGAPIVDLFGAPAETTAPSQV